MKLRALAVAVVIAHLSLPAPAASSYFEFHSDSSPSAAHIESIVKKFGPTALIGGDPSKENFEASMKAADRFGARKHVYLEGPGGPTGGGSQPDPDELARMKKGAFAAAASLGVSIDASNWRRLWNHGGLWLESTKLQIKSYAKRGFDSFEIDNLDQDVKDATGSDRDPGKTLALFRKLQAWMDNQNVKMSLLMKNVSPRQLVAIETALRAGELRREFFTDFAISEEGFDSERKAVRELASRMGIRLLRSADTNKYGVVSDAAERR